MIALGDAAVIKIKRYF